MADNVTTSVGTIATRESGGVHTQRTTGDTAAAATLTNIGAAAASTTIAASNTARQALYIFNDSTEAMYVKYGTSASPTSFTVKLLAGDFWEMPTRPIYTGELTAYWAAASGTGRVTEV